MLFPLINIAELINRSRIFQAPNEKSIHDKYISKTKEQIWKSKLMGFIISVKVSLQYSYLQESSEQPEHQQGELMLTVGKHMTEEASSWMAQAEQMEDT